MTVDNSEYKPLFFSEPIKWLRNINVRKRLRYWVIRTASISARFIDKIGFHKFFKYLWLRIILLNLIGLVLVVGGVYYFNGIRASLLAVKVKGLEQQGEIIVAVISASIAAGKRDDDFDTDALQWLYQDKSSGNRSNTPDVQFGINPQRFELNPQKIAPILERTVQLTNTRARVYESDGNLVVDSNTFLSSGQVIRALTPKRDTEQTRKGVFYEFTQMVASWLNINQLELYKDIGGANGKAYFEVEQALAGRKTIISRKNQKDQTIVSMAMPIRSGKNVTGVLLLTTKGVEIDKAVSTARREVMRVAFVALIVTLILSIYLTVTIAGPMRSLSKAITNVKRSIKKRHDIPDLTHRPDEIGQLSSALREMTFALYQRIEAIESFAADVSHELKNPLTSLRSAVETLPLAKREEDREHLIEVILNDVGRLNRLITDIASASRLDAELARADKSPVSIATMVRGIADIFNDIRSDDNKKVVVEYFPKRKNDKIFLVNGHEGRLGQVFNNLLDNALSFTEENGTVQIRVKRVNDEVEITVEDEGPGIPEDNLQKIFARFYTDRPGDNAFRENSGLGLNISQEIVRAHKGRIWAENRYRKFDTDEENKKPIGARFVVRLPATFAKKA